MRIAVTGGRNQYLTVAERNWLGAFLYGNELLVGDCPTGIDFDARRVKEGHSGFELTVFKADWDKHGRAAGPIRNAEMVSGADVLVVYPGGKGTESAQKAAVAKGVRVIDRRVY